jgi:hypothetical protein
VPLAPSIVTVPSVAVTFNASVPGAAAAQASAMDIPLIATVLLVATVFEGGTVMTWLGTGPEVVVVVPEDELPEEEVELPEEDELPPVDVEVVAVTSNDLLPSTPA